ncbi:lysyl aminopeptidase [Gottschalkia purinilytica]|uniref:Lysyl aminopeptidase n=1 Tax=Gottschalkia purinilytica TaxID=1503 RepID=A0A0L0WC04_GOTPU|nr:M42 family metallopeptidase [Gottschalkia purinilytica]KNF08950.1 lysyl aminopeptidase [Gottschalkia purinilytica]
MKINSELLKKLVDIYSPSGDEENICSFIKNEIKDYVDEINIDNLGNLIARKKGNGKKIMIASHMDQIGLMITNIEKEGFLRFTNIGGIDPHISLGQKVIFKDGTIGVIDYEETSDITKLKLENMYIDIGVSSKEEAEKVINIGDSCVYYNTYLEDDNRIISGALDDRIGCYISIETIKNLKNIENDLYFVFTVQEELGLRGAKTSAYSINPDLGIAVDITGSGDTPGAKKFAIELGKGASIKVKDKGIVVHPKVKKLMINTAKKHNIPYQLEIFEYGSTDSGAIHLTRGGVPSGVISVPTRYAHSPNETIYKKDVVSCIELLTKLLEKNIEI